MEKERLIMEVRSFRTRLLTLVTLALVPTGALVLIANMQRLQAEKDRIQEQAICAAKLAAGSEAHYVKNAQQVLATMSQFHFLVLSQNEGFCRTGMANLKLLQPDFADFGLIERDGTVFCHTLGTNVAGDVISPAFVRRVLDNPDFAMSELHRIPGFPEPFLQFIYPIRTNQRVARLVFASQKLSFFSKALTEIPVPEGGTITVIDQAGNIVARQPADVQALGTKPGSFPLIQRSLAETNDVFESEPHESSKRIHAVSSVTHGGKPLLFVEVAAPQKVLFAKADARFGASLGGLFLIALLVVSVAWLVSERALLSPVRAMLSATEKLIQGDLSARTGINQAGNELHVLARRFDVMAETLAGRQKQLESANSAITMSNAELERRVKERTEDLETLNRELEAFSYSVSHDLRAPLRHVDGFAQLLADEESLQSNEKAQRYLGLITQSAKRMNTLIDDLLSFSKMARQSMALQPVNSMELVESLVAELKATEPKREIVWEIGPLPVVLGDAAMLRQVWVNLISNAIKYTRGRAPARIEISSFKSADEFVFVVADNGVGFNMDYAEKLFGVFQRLHREQDFEGTGIGLANVRRIVARHRGRTWAEGEAGKGARFFFSLPRHQDGKPQAPGNQV